MSQNGCLRISRPLAVAHHGRAARCRSGGDRVLVAGSTQEAIVAAACGPALRTPCCPSTASSRLSWQLHSVLSRWQLRTNGRATRCRCGGDRVLVAGSTQEGHSGCGVRPRPLHALLPQRRECAALLAAPFGPGRSPPGPRQPQTSPLLPPFHIGIFLEPEGLKLA